MEQKENNKQKKAEAILKTSYHWGVFLFPALIVLSSIILLIQNKYSILFLIYAILFAIIFAALAYIFNYKDKKFILTQNKLYVMNKKEKIITLNLSHGEFRGYAYNESRIGKLLGYCHITLHVQIQEQKKVLNYFFVKDGKNFILNSFYQSEYFLSKLDSTYIRKLNNSSFKEKKTIDGVDIDRI